MRQLVSYDDITPCQEGEETQIRGLEESPCSSPPKKRKRSNQKRKPAWDQQFGEEARDYGEKNIDALPSQSGILIPGPSEQHAAVGEDEGEGQELTYEEIWDDSALINAWNAATEEYEAFHGKNKHWKKDPVHKSTFWHTSLSLPNKRNAINPSSRETSKSFSPVDEPPDGDGAAEDNSQPLDFDTFFPTHDPSLGFTLPQLPSMLPHDHFANHPQHGPGYMVDRDKAFASALGAMYWVGYWTAIFHCRKNDQPTSGIERKSDPDENAEYSADRSDVEDFVPTQR